MNTIVISAVNFTDGGPLKVLQDCVEAAVRHSPKWRVIALVNDPSLVSGDGVRALAYPKAKSSWARRIFHEWWIFRRLSRELAPDVWLSLHDLTPAVKAARRYVYCHNPAPFYRISFKEAALDPRFAVFNLFYTLVYRINIKKNRAVIVQQDWLRDAFRRNYGVSNIIVAHPLDTKHAAAPALSPCRTFFYPAFPRVFKNFELICEAAIRLSKDSRWQGEIRLTLAGCENRYARWIFRKYGHVPSIKFIGLQNRVGMASQYDASDCVLFPSKLETWGLPISEAKALDKPIIAADLPYARETVGSYARAQFIDPLDADALADAILEAHLVGVPTNRATQNPPASPFAPGWDRLMKLLLDDDPQQNPDLGCNKESAETGSLVRAW